MRRLIQWLLLMPALLALACIGTARAADATPSASARAATASAMLSMVGIVRGGCLPALTGCMPMATVVP